MKTIIPSLCLVLVAFGLGSCLTAEDAFTDDRLLKLCDEAYFICGRPTGCTLDKEHYVEGAFPGTRRVVIATEDVDTKIQVRLFFRTMESPGTELIAQLKEPNCTLDTRLAQEHLKDIDLFEEAGDDRKLVFDLQALQEGEHVLEIYADASAEYLLVVEPK